MTWCQPCPYHVFQHLIVLSVRKVHAISRLSLSTFNKLKFVDAPSLEVFKARLDGALSNLV